MPAVRSRLTRSTGLTTVNWFVKKSETSSPREAFSAICPGEILFLEVFGITLLLFCRFLVAIPSIQILMEPQSAEAEDRDSVHPQAEHLRPQHRHARALQKDPAHDLHEI